MQPHTASLNSREKMTATIDTPSPSHSGVSRTSGLPSNVNAHPMIPTILWPLVRPHFKCSEHGLTHPMMRSLRTSDWTSRIRVVADLPLQSLYWIMPMMNSEPMIVKACHTSAQHLVWLRLHSRESPCHQPAPMCRRPLTTSRTQCGTCAQCSHCLRGQCHILVVMVPWWMSWLAAYVSSPPGSCSRR